MIPITFTEDIFYGSKVDSNGYHVNETLKPGCSQWAKTEQDQEHSLLFMCPCGCCVLRVVPVLKGLKSKGAWTWDGNAEKPTLMPSIRVTTGCQWHGHLIEGNWVNA